MERVLADLNEANLDNVEGFNEDESEMMVGWNILRQRTDKVANAIKTAESIIDTIRNPVEEPDLKDLLEDLADVTFGNEGGQDTELGKRPRPDGFDVDDD